MKAILLGSIAHLRPCHLVKPNIQTVLMWKCLKNYLAKLLLPPKKNEQKLLHVAVFISQVIYSFYFFTYNKSRWQHCNNSIKYQQIFIFPFISSSHVRKFRHKLIICHYYSRQIYQYNTKARNYAFHCWLSN